MTEFVTVTARIAERPARTTAWRRPGFARERTELPTVTATGTLRDVHVRACVDRAADELWWSSADVLYHERTVSVRQLVELSHRFPGCAVCAGPLAGGAMVAVSYRCPDFRVLLIRVRRTEGAADTAADYVAATVGSAVHAWLAAGIRPTSQRRRVVPANSDTGLC